MYCTVADQQLKLTRSYPLTALGVLLINSGSQNCVILSCPLIQHCQAKSVSWQITSKIYDDAPTNLNFHYDRLTNWPLTCSLTCKFHHGAIHEVGFGAREVDCSLLTEGSGSWGVGHWKDYSHTVYVGKLTLKWWRYANQSIMFGDMGPQYVYWAFCPWSWNNFFKEVRRSSLSGVVLVGPGCYLHFSVLMFLMLR